MVGIVIVAHSTQLAEAVLSLTVQALRRQVPLAAAGGIDDAEHPFGTDATRIQQAIEYVYSNDGVVVLMDMGSAILSAEMSLEFLPEEHRAMVRLCEAPLVEGTIAAAVRSESGGTLEEVVEEARGALAAKAEQLQGEAAHPHPEISEPPSGTTEATVTRGIEVRLVIDNPLGIHARPAARFVTTAAQFQAEITVRNITRDTKAVSARSINLIATLGVRRGHEIAITADGPDSEEALEALRALVEENFGEDVTTVEYTGETIAQDTTLIKPQPARGEFTGIAVSPGIAIGPAFLYRPFLSKVPDLRIEDPLWRNEDPLLRIDDPPAEWQRLRRAVQTVRQEIRTMRTRISVQAGDYEAALFDAHLLSLEDPALIETARKRIFEQAVNAEIAWQLAVDDMLGAYHASDSPYLRMRAADLVDLKTQVLRLLTGTARESIELTEPSILVSADLHPSDLARLDLHKVSGICTAFGAATTHSSILARALGIPAVVCAGTDVLRLKEGSLLVLDGEEGRVWSDPDNIEMFKRKRKAWLASRKELLEAGQKPAVTLDGRGVKVAANIGSIAEAQSALEHGAEGIGVLRTEFLFLERITAPSEEEQLEAYRSIAEDLGQRPLIIRTLDVGGDKPLPYLDLQVENNPFLGRRGIRVCLDHSDIFKTQLRAILRASHGHPVKVMFPMISSVREIGLTKNILREAQDELGQNGAAFDKSMEIGIMVEVPSAVSVADRLAVEVNFFSIGTNDLSQYVMAADRTNARMAYLTDALHPAVLRMIHQTVQAGHNAGIWVGVCGELAGDPLAVPVLLGLGVDELSMSPPAIPPVKQTISRILMSEAEGIAHVVLNLDSAEEVRQYLKEKLFR